MFGFWKSKPAAPRSADSLPGPADLSDDALIGLLRQTFDSHNEVVAALFLVAYENFFVYSNLFYNAAQSSNEYPASMDGLVRFLAAGYAKHSSDSVDDEANRRRFFYLYLAALLKIAHERAKRNPVLWDAVAGIWVSLLPGARALRKTLDRTGLWKPDEIEFFQDIKTPDDGQTYCESLMLPSEIRYHARIKSWRERDLSPEVRAELDKIDKLFREKE